MANSKTFGSVLVRIRRERGYPSAFRFYNEAGGSKGLGMAFVSYWDIERGKKLPRSVRLKKVIAGLGLKPYSPETKELVRAYFIALSGSDELLRIVAEPETAPARSVAEMAAQRVASQLGVSLTPEQWKVRARDMLTNLCQACLEATSGWVTVRELSDGFGSTPEAVKKSLRALSGCGLVELSGDKARCGHAGKTVQPLSVTPATLNTRAALRANWNGWLGAKEPLDGKTQMVRFTPRALGQYLQHLKNAVDLAGVYGNADENRDSSSVYFVEGRIHRLFPKD